jgi:hypothetical protein
MGRRFDEELQEDARKRALNARISGNRIRLDEDFD